MKSVNTVCESSTSNAILKKIDGLTKEILDLKISYPNLKEILKRVPESKLKSIETRIMSLRFTIR